MLKLKFSSNADYPVENWLLSTLEFTGHLPDKRASLRLRRQSGFPKDRVVFDRPLEIRTWPHQTRFPLCEARNLQYLVINAKG